MTRYFYSMVAFSDMGNQSDIEFTADDMIEAEMIAEDYIDENPQTELVRIDKYKLRTGEVEELGCKVIYNFKEKNVYAG